MQRHSDCTFFVEEFATIPFSYTNDGNCSFCQLHEVQCHIVAHPRKQDPPPGPTLQALTSHIDESFTKVFQILSSRNSPTTSSFCPTPLRNDAGIRGLISSKARRLLGESYNSKRRCYRREFERVFKENPENSGYVVVYSSQNELFCIIKRSPNQTNELMLVLPATHAMLKSAFLCFGLCDYDVQKFLLYIQSYPIEPHETLSPEDSDLSRYIRPETDSDDNDADGQEKAEELFGSIPIDLGSIPIDKLN